MNSGETVNKSNDQSGSILVMVLLIFAVVYILSIAAFRYSILEYHMSVYTKNSEAAYQAAEAGVSYACRQLLTLLEKDYTHVEVLPNELTLTDSSLQLTTEKQNAKADISTAEKVSQAEDTCIYRFTSQGSYARGVCELKVEVSFAFENHYAYIFDENGNLLSTEFQYREYIGPGKIVTQEKEP